MTDSFDEMRRLLASQDFSALQAARDAMKPLEALKMANPGGALMEEIARQKRMMDQLALPHINSARALMEVNSGLATIARNDGAISAALKAIYEPAGRIAIDAAHSHFAHERAVASSLIGSIAQLRDSGALASFNASEAINAAKALVDYESQFRVAARADLDMISSITRADHQLASMFKADILTATRASDLAFVRANAPLASVQAFAELQGLSRGVTSLAPFSDELTHSLRVDLGDWRGLAGIPETSYADIATRTSFYVDQGLRAELTDFPAVAFESVIALRRADPISIAEQYGDPIEAPDDEDETEFARTNEVQGWLHRYERQMRRFINERMTKAFGPDWPRLKLPPETYRDWSDKSQKAAAAGKPHAPLIIFADFTHYMPIVCNKGNWPHFQDAFGTKDAGHIRESFFRLELPRIEVSHGRMLTQEDYLLIYAELLRMNRAIKPN